LKVTEPVTAAPPDVTVNDTVLGCTGSENVAVGATDTGLDDDPAAGVTPVTDGGVDPDEGV
jgi:hypothetical protein